MMTNENSQLTKLQERIEYDEAIFESYNNYVKIMNQLLEDSRNICLETLFPFDDFSDYELPTKYYNWQIRCCIELYNMADKQGFVNYSENSLSFAKLADGLSNSLMNKLTSRVGVPKSESN